MDRYGSAKIKYSILTKLIADKNLTSKEIDLFLWLALRQSDIGIVTYVKYNEVCADIGISIQEYYNCVYALVERGYITVTDKNRTQGWHIQIIDNKFSDSRDDKNRYIKVNYDFFYEKTFIDMRANEKKLILHIVSHYIPQKDSFIKLDQIKELLQTPNAQLIRSYIDKIRYYFYIERKTYNNKSSNVFMIGKDSSAVDNPLVSVAQKFLNYWLKAIFRVKKIICSVEALQDLITLFQQYKKYFDIVETAMFVSLGKTNNTIEPKYIHSIITTEIKARQDRQYDRRYR